MGLPLKDSLCVLQGLVEGPNLLSCAVDFAGEKQGRT